MPKFQLALKNRALPISWNPQELTKGKMLKVPILTKKSLIFALKPDIKFKILKPGVKFKILEEASDSNSHQNLILTSGFLNLGCRCSRKIKIWSRSMNAEKYEEDPDGSCIKF